MLRPFVFVFFIMVLMNWSCLEKQDEGLWKYNDELNDLIYSYQFEEAENMIKDVIADGRVDSNLILLKSAALDLLENNSILKKDFFRINNSNMDTMAINRMYILTAIHYAYNMEVEKSNDFIRMVSTNVNHLNQESLYWLFHYCSVLNGFLSDEILQIYFLKETYTKSYKNGDLLSIVNLINFANYYRINSDYERAYAYLLKFQSSVKGVVKNSEFLEDYFLYNYSILLLSDNKILEALSVFERRSSLETTKTTTLTKLNLAIISSYLGLVEESKQLWTGLLKESNGFNKFIHNHFTYRYLTLLLFQKRYDEFDSFYNNIDQNNSALDLYGYRRHLLRAKYFLEIDKPTKARELLFQLNENIKSKNLVDSFLKLDILWTTIKGVNGNSSLYVLYRDLILDLIAERIDESKNLELIHYAGYYYKIWEYILSNEQDHKIMSSIILRKKALTNKVLYLSNRTFDDARVLKEQITKLLYEKFATGITPKNYNIDIDAYLHHLDQIDAHLEYSEQEKPVTINYIQEHMIRLNGIYVNLFVGEKFIWSLVMDGAQSEINRIKKDLLLGLLEESNYSQGNQHLLSLKKISDALGLDENVIDKILYINPDAQLYSYSFSRLIQLNNDHNRLFPVINYNPKHLETITYSKKNFNRFVCFTYSSLETLKGMNISELPYSLKEKNVLRQLYANKFKDFSGKNCTKQSLLETLNAPTDDIIHISTHAHSDSFNMFNSYLTLREESKLDELYTYEIGNIKADKLIFLNACNPNNTIRAKGLSGTGSITHTLSEMGAQIVISPTKPINDAAAHMFSTNFHTKYSDTKDLILSFESTIKQSILNENYEALEYILVL